MVLVAIRVVVYDGPKFIALTLATHELITRELGREDGRAALGGPGWLTWWPALVREELIHNFKAMLSQV